MRSFTLKLVSCGVRALLTWRLPQFLSFQVDILPPNCPLKMSPPVSGWIILKPFHCCPFKFLLCSTTATFPTAGTAVAIPIPGPWPFPFPVLWPFTPLWPFPFPMPWPFPFLLPSQEFLPPVPNSKSHLSLPVPLLLAVPSLPS